ncbi:MAG: DUF1996 domain-containing protein [Acidimicrobiales bacterium]
MAGTWKTRAIAAGAALLVVFAITAIIDTVSDGGTFVESAPATETSRDEITDAERGRLQATGTTLETLAQDTSPAAVETTGDEAVSDPQPDLNRGSIEQFESIRNVQSKFSRFASTNSAQLDLSQLTEAAPVYDNGGSTAGQFRVACEYSHFGYDDPIIFPGEPGRSHLHMFFGNTETNAFTTQDQLVNSGGGTCSGFELNRSGYWTPALLDGKGNAVVPDAIIIYYKTKFPNAVTAMPQGLKMLAGNTQAESFQNDLYLFWSCGANGFAYGHTNRIPDCKGDVINASIQFPNCWDGVNLGAADFTSHLTYANDQQSCPGSHPKRLPQISILLYYPGVDSVNGWKLSSDDLGGFNGPPGGTLHADWWGGWNDEAMDLWIDGCMKASRNCSYGQTGTARQLAGLNPLEVYEGDNFLPLEG